MKTRIYAEPAVKELRLKPVCRDQRAARSFPILRRPMQSLIQWPPKLIFHACPLVSNVVCGPCSKQYHLIIGHVQSARKLL